MNEVATMHCGKASDLQISQNSKRWRIPFPGKVGPVFCGVTAQEKKWADSWEPHSHDYSDVHKESAGITKKSQNQLKDRGKDIKVNKGAHPEKDGFGSSGLMGGSRGGICPMQVLDLLHVSVQDENHGDAGPEHRPQT